MNSCVIDYLVVCSAGSRSTMLRRILSCFIAHSLLGDLQIGAPSTSFTEPDGSNHADVGFCPAVLLFYVSLYIWMYQTHWSKFRSQQRGYLFSCTLHIEAPQIRGLEMETGPQPTLFYISVSASLTQLEGVSRWTMNVSKSTECCQSSQ
jgi:hypothetical protein